MVSPFHHIQKKRRKKFHDYSQKSIDNFKLVIVYPSPKLSDQENCSIVTSFGYSYQDQCIKTNTMRVLTNVLERWN